MPQSLSQMIKSLEGHMFNMREIYVKRFEMVQVTANNRHLEHRVICEFTALFEIEFEETEVLTQGFYTISNVFYSLVSDLLAVWEGEF